MATEHLLPGTPSVQFREWQRFSTLERVRRFGVYFGLVLAVVVSVVSIEVIPEFLADAPAQMLDLLQRMWPIDWAHFPSVVWPALVESLHIAALATILGLIMGIPVGFIAARNAVGSRILNSFARFILTTTRSISTLLWALFFVAMFGPGALAGALAIAFHSIGFIGKMFSEAVEEAPPGPIEALTAAGATRLQKIIYGFWPQVKPSFWSIALFRWDINVRESAVLGLVGAGGIGMTLDTAINLLQWDRVALVLITIFGVVLIIEALVTLIREKVL